MPTDGEDIDGQGIQEVARQLGVHEQTLRRWIWRGRVRATRSQVGRSYRWLVQADPGLPIAGGAALDGAATQTQTIVQEACPEDVSPHREPTVARSAVSQRERLSAIEEQIEREIRRLGVEAAALQAEISRLSHTLAVLRSEAEP